MTKENIAEIVNRVNNVLQKKQKITFLVGAGISADSGIPTFRGQEGYWTIGSKNYHPQEMATKRMFAVNAEEVWKWYLYRKSIVEQAEPNESHFKLKELEDLLGDNFALVTQNVDGLHKRAGSDFGKMYAIHGDLNYVRCENPRCHQELVTFPTDFDWNNRSDNAITDQEWKALHCLECGELMRPHVLWFDECYNEKFYRFDSVKRLALETGVLFILGTSGATNLPMQLAEDVLNERGFVVEVNTDESYFSKLLRDQSGTLIIRTKSSYFLSELAKELR